MSFYNPFTAEPQEEERKELNQVIPQDELKKLLDGAGKLLGVHPDQFDNSIRHNVVKKVLQDTFQTRGVTNIPLAVKRRSDNPDYVTWSGSNTVLGEQVKNINLHTETRVTKLRFNLAAGKIDCATVRDLNTDKDKVVIAKVWGVLQRGLNPNSRGQYLGLHYCMRSDRYPPNSLEQFDHPSQRTGVLPLRTVHGILSGSNCLISFE